MRILLDTHVFLWCIRDDTRLTKAAREYILQATEVFVSSASIWELSIKIKLKKLDGDILDIVKAITKSGFCELPVTVHHATRVVDLPEIHRDPFDRMLVAQAISEPLSFLTSDKQFKDYSNLVHLI